jgi:hypothetical protein
VEIGPTEEGDRGPRAASVCRLDETQSRREALRPCLVDVRMAGAEEAVSSGDREAHRVLAARADTFGCSAVPCKAPSASVRGDEESAVGGVSPQPMDMHRPGVGSCGKRRHLGLVVAREKQRASGAESGDRKCDGEDSALTLTTRPKSLKDRTLAHGCRSILLMPSQQLAKCLMPSGPAGVAASPPPLNHLPTDDRAKSRQANGRSEP